MTTMQGTEIVVDSSIADKLREWFDAGRGVRLWVNQEIGCARPEQFTPADNTTPPHWAYKDGGELQRENVAVETFTERTSFRGRLVKRYWGFDLADSSKNKATKLLQTGEMYFWEHEYYYGQRLAKVSIGSNVILDCGHEPNTKHTYNGKPAWEFVLDGERKICHACADKRVLDCGHTPSPHSHITTGYGEFEGKQYCYDCCTARDVAQMDDASDKRPFCAYLSEDSKTITNWPGRKLARVASVRKVWNNFARDYLLWVTAVVDAVDGRPASRWSGLCPGPGRYVRLHRRKG